MNPMIKCLVCAVIFGYTASHQAQEVLDKEQIKNSDKANTLSPVRSINHLPHRHKKNNITKKNKIL